MRMQSGFKQAENYSWKRYQNPKIISLGNGSDAAEIPRERHHVNGAPAMHAADGSARAGERGEGSGSGHAGSQRLGNGMYAPAGGGHRPQRMTDV